MNNILEELLKELNILNKKVVSLEKHINGYKEKEKEYKSIINRMNNRIDMLEGVVQTVPAGVMIVDENRNITEINKVIENMIMKDKYEIIGKKGGEGFRCYNSFSLTECGTGRICETCPLKNSVEYVLHNGKSLLDVDVNPTLIINNEIKNPWLRLNILYATINNRKHAILLIKDITSEKINKQLNDIIREKEEEIKKLKEMVSY